MACSQVGYGKRLILPGVKQKLKGKKKGGRKSENMHDLEVGTDEI